MNRNHPVETIEAWLAEGPTVAPTRLMAQLPASVAGTRQGGMRGGLRFAWLVVPAAAAVVAVAVLLSTLLAPEVGEDSPVDIPSPPAVFEEGDRVDLVLRIANLSDRPHASWYWTGNSGGGPIAMPCYAVVTEYKVRAPGVVRFGEVDPDTDASRESLPVILDTASLPGHPVAYRDDATQVWTYAYEITVSEEGTVGVEPLDAIPSLASAGPLCPVPDTSWPGGWPEIQAWLADRPALADCGLERVEASPVGAEPVRDTEARRCLYEAWEAGEDAQLAVITFTDSGPVLELTRTVDGTVEQVWQQLRSGVSADVVTTSCWQLVRPSESSAGSFEPEDDETLVFVLEPLEDCR